MNRTKIVVAALAALGIVVAFVGRDRGKGDPSPPPTEGSTGKAPNVEALTPEASVSAPVAAGSDAAAPAHGTAKVLFSAKWGSNLGELGHMRPQEANPEGPKSFALTDQGYVVLDQLNGRLVHYDNTGTPGRTIPVSPTTDDVAVAKDGKMALLDRLVDKSVSVIDPDGKKVGQLSLEAAGIKTPGTTTGVYVEGKNVYAERDHGALVLLGTTDGKPADSKSELSGRPSKDGALLVSAGVISANDGLIYLNVFDRTKNALRFTRRVNLGFVLHQLVLLDTDAKNTIYIGGWSLRPSDTIQILCLSSTDGQRLGQTTLPVNQAPEESFRDLVVGPDGTIIYALRSEQGVEYLRTTCP